MNFNPILLSIKIKPDIILDMVKVETEPFFIRGENGSFDGMKRVVNIEKDFYISKFEITQKQWAAIMQSPAPTKYPGPNRPLDEVSLEDAMNFCNKISQITGLTFTLPTEAQWEFAAKGGKYSQGYILAGGNNPELLFSKNEIDDGYQSLTYDVGLFPPNELGLYDMNSNVSEWCVMANSDKYGGGAGSDVLKGGVMGDEGGLIWEECSIAEQIGESADSYSPNVGFRVVLCL